jgi:hypothetical protein
LCFELFECSIDFLRVENPGSVGEFVVAGMMPSRTIQEPGCADAQAFGFLTCGVPDASSFTSSIKHDADDGIVLVEIHVQADFHIFSVAFSQDVFQMFDEFGGGYRIK